MTNTPPPPPPPLSPVTAAPATAAGTLDIILQTLLPVLLLSSLSVQSFPGRWRLLRTKLTQLQTSLTEASRGPNWSHHPLFRDLLPALLSTLRSLHSLSDRCHDPSLPGGKLLLQSDLDIAASSLSLHLHDLDLLLRSGLLHHHHHHYPNAIVLSHPGPNSSKEDLALFVRDLFARLQIGGIDLKKKALDSLLRLLSEESSSAAKISAIVAQEGDLGCLVHLLDSSNHSLIREQAAAAVSILSTASDRSKKAVFEEGGLGPLLRLLENGSASGKEKATVAIEAITSDPANAWAVPAYGGVSILIEACKSSNSKTRARAAGSLKNIAVAVGDVRKAMAEEGAIPVLLELLLSGDEVRKNAVHCLWIMASSCSSSSGGEPEEEDFRVSIVEEGGLQKLIQLFLELAGSNPELLEHVLRAIHSLSELAAASRVLSSSSGFLIQLAELIKYGNASTQHISVSLLCNLCPSEEGKRSMAGCMGALVKMLESSKPVNSQEVSALALVTLLAVRSNRKDLVRDEKSLTRLVQMLDQRNEAVCKKFPVTVVSALAAGGNGCRKRLAAAGACQHLQKLADIDVPGSKKALQRIAGNRLKNIFSSISWRE